MRDKYNVILIKKRWKKTTTKKNNAIGIHRDSNPGCSHVRRTFSQLTYDAICISDEKKQNMKALNVHMLDFDIDIVVKIKVIKLKDDPSKASSCHSRGLNPVI